MALDTTIAGTSANSYLTVADGDAFAAAALGPEAKAWEDATVEEREKALMQATTAVDTVQRSRHAYVDPYAVTQALLFPRDIDTTGSPLAPFLYAIVKRAVFVQAAWLLRNVNLLADAASHVAAGVFSQSDGDGSWTAAADPTRGLYAPEMLALLNSIPSTGHTRRPRLVSVPIDSPFDLGRNARVTSWNW